MVFKLIDCFDFSLIFPFSARSWNYGFIISTVKSLIFNSVLSFSVLKDHCFCSGSGSVEKDSKRSLSRENKRYNRRTRYHKSLQLVSIISLTPSIQSIPLTTTELLTDLICHPTSQPNGLNESAALCLVIDDETTAICCSHVKFFACAFIA